MAKKVEKKIVKKRGRPPGVRQGRPFTMRVDEEFIAKVDEFRRMQPDLPNRTDAIRRMVDMAVGKVTKR
jgi:hypothetical protein